MIGGPTTNLGFEAMDGRTGGRGIFNWSIRIVTRVTFSPKIGATSKETVGSVEGVHGESDGTTTCKIAAYLRWNCNYDKLELPGMDVLRLLFFRGA